MACHLVEGVASLQAFCGHSQTVTFQLFEGDAFLIGQCVAVINNGCQPIVEQHLTSQCGRSAPRA